MTRPDGTWFRAIMGFDEDPGAIHHVLQLHGEDLVSRADGRRIPCGRLGTPSLAELRTGHRDRAGHPSIREVVADVRGLHADPGNAHAVFQVASQFNLLEMASPQATPEHGITIYAHDHTQGPACAMAAVGGTLFRNYFVPFPDGSRGQTRTRQLDMLAGIGQLLNNDGTLWRLLNGYALFDPRTAPLLAQRLGEHDPDAVRAALRVGCHAEVGVTLPGTSHRVTQVYGSALPLAYMDRPTVPVYALAELVLEASYEATLRIAASVSAPRVFLTLLGGGVFGNPRPTILAAIDRALRTPGLGELDVRIVSHGRSQPDVAAFCEGWTA